MDNHILFYLDVVQYGKQEKVPVRCFYDEESKRHLISVRYLWIAMGQKQKKWTHFSNVIKRMKRSDDVYERENFEIKLKKYVSLDLALDLCEKYKRWELKLFLQELFVLRGLDYRKKKKTQEEKDERFIQALFC